MNYILALFLFTQILFSSELQNKEVSVFSSPTISEEVENKQVIKETTLLEIKESTSFQTPKKEIIDYSKEVFLLDDTFSQAKTLYLSYQKFPDVIYQKQIFSIDIKVIVARDNYEKIDIRFLDALNVSVLNADSAWSEIKEQEYENKFYFKVSASDFVMPRIQVLLYNNGILEETQYLDALKLEFTHLANGNKRFSNVIAKELIVNNYKTKQYNNKELLTVLDLSAQGGNLEDFTLGVEYLEQGSTSFDQNYPSQNLIYHVIVPIHTKKITFNYYSLKTNSFISINLPIILENELISTQSDLNPNNSNFEFYKKIAIFAFLFFFLIITLWKRKLIYLIITLVFVILLILYVMPNKTAIIQKDVIIYILPTKNSTVFFKTQKEQLVEILNHKAGFYKVLFNTNDQNAEIIGWIKENNVSKN